MVRKFILKFFLVWKLNGHHNTTNQYYNQKPILEDFEQGENTILQIAFLKKRDIIFPLKDFFY